MTPFERLIESLANFSFNFHWVFKIPFLFGMLFYLAFGIIVIRQVSLMSKTLEGSFNLPIKMTAWIHLGMIIGLFLIILLAF